MRNTFSKLTLLSVVLMLGSLVHGGTFTEDFQTTAVGFMPPSFIDVAGDIDVVDLGGGDLRAQTQCCYGFPQITTFGSDTWLNTESTMIVRSENYAGRSGLYFGYRARVQPDGSAFAVRWFGAYPSTDPRLQICYITPAGGVAAIATSSTTSTMGSAENWQLTFNVENNDTLGQVELFAEMSYVSGGDGIGVTKTLNVTKPYTDSLFSAQPSLLLPGKCALWGQDNDANTRKFSWDDINIVYSTGDDNPAPVFLAHFNDDGSYGHLGDGFVRKATPAQFYPDDAALFSGAATFDANGKFFGAVDLDDTGATYTVDGHYDFDPNAAYTTEFWWKPNFPEPDGTTDVDVTIFEWRTSGGGDGVYLKYKYRQATNDEYLIFRVPGFTTNTAPLVVTDAGSVDFNGFNFVAFRWLDSDTLGDAIGVKLNDSNLTYKVADPLAYADAGPTFTLKNGVFDEYRIVDDFLSPAEAEDDRALNAEFQPDSIPADCTEAKAMYGRIPGDIADDGDCVVNMADFAAFSADWMDCILPGGCN